MQNKFIAAGKFKVFVYIFAFLSILSFQISFSSLQAEKRNVSLNNHMQNENIKLSVNQPPYDDYYQEDYLRYSDFVYSNNIKSILFNQKGWELSPPIIELNSSERLVLQFDDLDGDFKNYSYTIIHCNAFWQPSDLMEFEYIEGFFEDRLNDFAFSRNTRVAYTHYMLEFPNHNMRPKLPGNYILKIFRDGDRDDLVLTRRFMVYEPLITIQANVKQATNLRYRDIKQEINFSINTNRYNITNPFRDLKVVVTQNGRWDNAIFNVRPRLVQGDMLIYDLEDEVLFMGGNEFRNFDIKSLRHRSLRVKEINPVGRGWEVKLFPDRNRRFMRYTTSDDINGRFLIKNDDFPDDMLESDYAWVHFTLPHTGAISEGNVYVAGKLTDWTFTSRNRMEYNYRDSQYELKLLLKQGFYDYLYAFLEDGSELADPSIFEGSHSIAENEYTIYVYYRKPGELFDSLIGLLNVHYGR
ncbi:MAG: DUF5103 domain-containing protein [Bacteroidetes bacterium]|nr:MAG: DUF5103 domain-containing protein [Bacteroidota bacterium]